MTRRGRPAILARHRTVSEPRPEGPLNDELQARADERLERALRERGARDPRVFYRERLRSIKQESPEAYEGAVAYYRETLLPSIDEGTDPIVAWTEYGRRLSEFLAPGRTVTVDASGRAEAYRAPADPDALVLHLPDSRRGRSLLVGLPADPSPAQRATYTWLVEGRNSLPGGGDATSTG